MWFSRRRHKKTSENGKREPSINDGIYYLYLIIGVQVLFVFGLLAAIMVIGKVLATPMWVFVFSFVLAVAGCVYIYRKAKLHLQRLREGFQQANLRDRNYEISFMGGVLTMRVEQNTRPLLEAPPNPILDKDTIESSPRH